jgi:WXG100 family type VII secretion target
MYDGDMGTTIKGDFDQLERVAAIFSGQADETRNQLRSLQRNVSALKGGDWVGRGAKAFYGEMDDDVTPSMKNLVDALDGGANSLKKISKVMKDAENDVTRLFSAEAIAAALSAAAGAAGVIAAGAAGAAAAAGALGGAIAAGVAAAQRAAEDAAVDSMLSKFSPKVRDMVKKSPTLRAQMLNLQQKGFKIKTGPIAGGSATNSGKKEIVIGQPDTDTETVSGLAHEVGHGLSTLPGKIQPTASTTKAQYVKANVDNMMQNEGGAQFNAAQVRAELNKAGGPDIGIPGTQTKDYQKVYDNYTAGKITKDQAVTQMGKLMGNERTSTPPKKPYHQYYGDWYRNDWDTNIAPGRKTK